MSQKTILYVEDNALNRKIVRDLLRKTSHQLLEAVDGEQGVAMAIRHRPDLILMDVRMPRMTGYEACRILKGDPKSKNILLVFLSAKGQESEIQQGLEAGADEYWLKPFAPDQLTRLVNNILWKGGLGIYDP